MALTYLLGGAELPWNAPSIFFPAMFLLRPLLLVAIAQALGVEEIESTLARALLCINRRTHSRCLLIRTPQDLWRARLKCEGSSRGGASGWWR